MSKTITVYNINELKEKFPNGYKKAIEFGRELSRLWRDDIAITDYLERLLEEKGLKGLIPLYSLGYSQGDGVAFTGNIDIDELINKNHKFKELLKCDNYDLSISVENVGRYCHYNSMEVGVNGNLSELLMCEIQSYVSGYLSGVSQELEKKAYAYIEEDQKEENVIDLLTANDYYFTKDGNRISEGD